MFACRLYTEEVFSYRYPENLRRWSVGVRRSRKEKGTHRVPDVILKNDV